MNEARLKTLLEAYGADPARWPAGDRDAALALMAAGGAHVQAWLEDAQMLDAALGHAARFPAPSADLHDRVAQSVPRSSYRGRVGGAAPWAGAALAASALLGLALGWTSAPHPPGDVFSEELSVGVALDVFGGAGEEG